MSESGKDEPTGLTVKRTVFFSPRDWERIEAAALKLSSETHTDISEPKFIRGAVAKRCDEVLNGEAA